MIPLVNPCARRIAAPATPPTRRRFAPAPLLAASLAALLVAGCTASPEPRYYTLAQPLPPSAVPPASAVPLWIEVAPVRVPERLNRQQLVVDDGDGQLRRMETARWSAPLPDEMRDALSQRLQTTLGAVDVYQRGLPDAQPLFRVSADVVAMDAAPGGAVSALINWTVRRLPDGMTQSGRVQTALPAPGGLNRAEGVVAAYRATLDQAAAQIAAGIAALQR